MTTQVIVRSANPNHENILVEVIQDGNPSQLQVLTDGEEASFYVYSSQSLKITEVPKNREGYSL